MKNQEKEIALVYLVAGLSTRYGGKIKAFAKVTKNKTLIEYSLNQALKLKFSEIIFVVGEKTKRAFKKKFKNQYKGVPVYYALQKFDKKHRDKPWGTADALCFAAPFLNCPFIVCNGDDIYGEGAFKILFEHLKKNNEEATAGYKLISVLPKKGEVNRGIIKQKNGLINSIKDSFNISKENLGKNKLKEDDLCSMNIFALHPRAIKLMNLNLKKFKKSNKKDRKIECMLPHEISRLIKHKKIRMHIYNSLDKWYGITNPGDEKLIQKDLKRHS